MQEMRNAIFDNSEILEDCFKKLNRVNSVTRGCKKPTNLTGDYIDVWLVETEVEILSKSTNISYYLCFKSTFPYSLPKFVLDKYELPIKYIPHVEENNSICLFDDNIAFSIDDPFELIKECLDRANRTISEGYQNLNTHHFTEEIKAYWSNKYQNENEPLQAFVHTFISYPAKISIVNIIEQKRSFYGNYRYIIYDNEDLGLIKFFNHYKKNAFIVRQGLFIPDLIIPDTPPYYITNSMLASMLSDDSLRAFKKYINSKEQSDKYIFFYLNKDGLIGGLKYPAIRTDIKGFRPNVLSVFDILVNQQKSVKVTRLLSEEYSNNRIENRTSGELNKKWKFLIAGLGSVGSHLTYFLNNINHPEFTFVDNDLLSIDNIGRHLLGYVDVKKSKSNAMVEYIKYIRPDQVALGEIAIIEEYILKHINEVNNNDYLFLAIGNKLTEDFIIKMISEGNIRIPIFILWVEPYLASGHCLFLQPHDAMKYNEQFNGHLYNYHVISNDEYSTPDNPKIIRREAGCQASFSPYSGNDLVIFLSALYPHINSVVRGTQHNSFRFSWIGDINKIASLEISISKEYNTNDSFTSKLTEI